MALLSRVSPRNQTNAGKPSNRRAGGSEASASMAENGQTISLAFGILASMNTSFRVVAVPGETFAPFFAMTDGELADKGAHRLIADKKPFIRPDFRARRRHGSNSGRRGTAGDAALPPTVSACLRRQRQDGECGGQRRNRPRSTDRAIFRRSARPLPPFAQREGRLLLLPSGPRLPPTTYSPPPPTGLFLMLSCKLASMYSRFIRAMNEALISFGQTAEQL